jgi:hypothetical protein
VAWLSLAREPSTELIWADTARWITPTPRDPERWTVTRIWTLASQRRRGWARWLLAVASAYVGTRVEELAWMAPLEADGHALAESIRPGRIWLA